MLGFVYLKVPEQAKYHQSNTAESLKDYSRCTCKKVNGGSKGVGYPLAAEYNEVSTGKVEDLVLLAQLKEEHKAGHKEYSTVKVIHFCSP